MINKCRFSLHNEPEGSLSEIPRGCQQSRVCSRIAEELPDIGPRGGSRVTFALVTFFIGRYNHFEDFIGMTLPPRRETLYFL